LNFNLREMVEAGKCVCECVCGCCTVFTSRTTLHIAELVQCFQLGTQICTNASQTDCPPSISKRKHVKHVAHTRSSAQEHPHVKELEIKEPENKPTTD